MNLELTFAYIQIAETYVSVKGNFVRRTFGLERTLISKFENLAAFSTSIDFKECYIEQALSFQSIFCSVMN